MPRTEAERILRAANLVLAEGGRRPGQDRPDIVLEQTPAANTMVAQGSRVTVILSAEPTGVLVPDVQGRTRTQAELILKRLGLQMAVGGQRESEGPADTVLDQKPEPGTRVRPGATVTVTLSAPRPELGRLVQVPDVQGRPRAEAERILKAAGLAMTEADRRPSPEPPDTVLEQRPGPGTQVRRGTTVAVIVSTRPATAVVPDVRGRSLAEAERLLQSADLAMVEGERRPSQERPDTVLEQSPAPGTRVRRGTSVTVIVSAPSPTVRVPDVRGRSRAEAARILRGADLAYVEGDRRPSTGPADVVIEQDPRPGTQATPGAAVTVILSTASVVPPQLVAVPDLRGQSQTEATQRLQAVGLVLSVGERQESREPADVILQQEPSPGVQARRGTTVTVTLSTPVFTITVPDVLGRTRPDAEQILRSAELRMVEGERRPSPERPDLVLEQDPRPRAQVTRGSAVTVVISAPAGHRVQWPVAAAAGAAALAGVGAVRWLRSRKAPGGKVPDVRITVRPDPGVQTLDVATEDVRIPTLQLWGQSDPGQQEMIMHEGGPPEEGQP